MRFLARYLLVALCCASLPAAVDASSLREAAAEQFDALRDWAEASISQGVVGALHLYASPSAAATAAVDDARPWARRVAAAYGSLARATEPSSLPSAVALRAAWARALAPRTDEEAGSVPVEEEGDAESDSDGGGGDDVNESAGGDDSDSALNELVSAAVDAAKDVAVDAFSIDNSAITHLGGALIAYGASMLPPAACALVQCLVAAALVALFAGIFPRLCVALLTKLTAPLWATLDDSEVGASSLHDSKELTQAGANYRTSVRACMAACVRTCALLLSPVEPCALAGIYIAKVLLHAALVITAAFCVIALLPTALYHWLPLIIALAFLRLDKALNPASPAASVSAPALARADAAREGAAALQADVAPGPLTGDARVTTAPPTPGPTPERLSLSSRILRPLVVLALLLQVYRFLFLWSSPRALVRDLAVFALSRSAVAARGVVGLCFAAIGRAFAAAHWAVKASMHALGWVLTLVLCVGVLSCLCACCGGTRAAPPQMAPSPPNQAEVGVAAAGKGPKGNEGKKKRR